MSPTAHRIRIVTIAVVVWVIWVEEPVGSDQWSVAHIPAPRFDTREACEQNDGAVDSKGHDPALWCAEGSRPRSSRTAR